MEEKFFDEEKLLDVPELAQHLKTAPSWVYGKTRTREIPCIRVGKYCRFRLSEVMSWLREQE